MSEDDVACTTEDGRRLYKNKRINYITARVRLCPVYRPCLLLRNGDAIIAMPRKLLAVEIGSAVI